MAEFECSDVRSDACESTYWCCSARATVKTPSIHPFEDHPYYVGVPASLSPHYSDGNRRRK